MLPELFARPQLWNDFAAWHRGDLQDEQVVERHGHAILHQFQMEQLMQGGQTPVVEMGGDRSPSHGSGPETRPAAPAVAPPETAERPNGSGTVSGVGSTTASSPPAAAAADGGLLPGPAAHAALAHLETGACSADGGLPPGPAAHAPETAGRPNGSGTVSGMGPTTASSLPAAADGGLPHGPAAHAALAHLETGACSADGGLRPGPAAHAALAHLETGACGDVMDTVADAADETTPSRAESW